MARLRSITCAPAGILTCASGPTSVMRSPEAAPPAWSASGRSCCRTGGRRGPRLLRGGRALKDAAVGPKQGGGPAPRQGVPARPLLALERGRERGRAEQSQCRRFQPRSASHRVFASHRVILPKGLVTPGLRCRRPGSARLYIEARPGGPEFLVLVQGHIGRRTRFRRSAICLIMLWRSPAPSSTIRVGLLVDAIGPSHQSLPYPPLGRSGWRARGTAAMPATRCGAKSGFRPQSANAIRWLDHGAIKQ